ncbi:UDP-N-acetylmuramoyl-tripeptide--D-alanyl-D-alanine ligase-like [Telopea speciosissima]|uniref:UDP-N-acetylmuramoyl-tripeptide--D-alanyl-D- alanine ligase-like n=1 Tax=Telopea speciosissima TaxID=54955 RepID=UPI001CC4FEC0|nr:UDP-N-acetylmuramoyl-tripeptide--D-alanyl-D-alanine ligase-like [Telopea speciosissima]XP_043715119.1 UDP-N-acetylmuramoyl-tripeptide--D-alanyl-D-alanine ligase-like [Telopea speciosissima]
MAAISIQSYAHKTFSVKPGSFRSSVSGNHLSCRISVCCRVNYDLVKKPFWSVTEIAEAVNGKIVKWGPSGTISTDSRNLKPGQWFFTIVGKNFDAHDFVNPELRSKGCIGVIGNRICEEWDMGFVQVEENTLIALEKMAMYARKRFHGRVVGVTGSVGKTTTRAMIAHALESLGSIHQTQGNQNNEIGVGLSLIGLPQNVKVSVLELGMSEKGEILKLTRMCQPSLRIILNVGPSHLVNFGSLEEVARAKGEILMEAKPGDVCVLNADDPRVMNLPVPEGVEKVFFGQRIGCDVRLVSAESTDDGNGVRVILERSTEVVEFVIPTPGLHLALNACAAAAVAVRLGVSLSQVGVSLSRFVPVPMRLELEMAPNGIKIINDVYNANPTSTRAAIDLLKTIDCKGKRVAILGDMLELGPAEIEAHRDILKLCFDSHIDLVALVGKRLSTVAEDLDLLRKRNAICTLYPEALALPITEKLASNDVVLVKGSRGMRMEKVVGAIKEMSI